MQNTPKKVFIHTNSMQYLGALLAKFAIERHLPKDSPITAEIINVDDLPIFKSFAGATYLRSGKEVTYDPHDLQSFTLSRFMPPELMHYHGRAIVIDPDIFALDDITPLMEMDLKGYPITACRKKDAWDSSTMLMDCAKLTHFKVSEMMEKLKNKELAYDDIMQLRKEPRVLELSRIWNSLDVLTDETKMLHTTQRLTQPWSTGLPIDFTINPMPKYFGIIPREPIHKLLGKYPTHYLPHPDKKIERFFLSLVKDALAAGVVTKENLEHDLTRGRLRKDIFEKLATV